MISMGDSVGTSIVQLLQAKSATDTAGATSAWKATKDYDGFIKVVVNTGAVTAGSVAWAIHTASDDQGTGDAALTPIEGAFTTVSTSNDPMSQQRHIDSRASLGYIAIVGTVTTGPALVSADLVARKKIIT